MHDDYEDFDAMSREYAYLDGCHACEQGEPFENGAKIIYAELRQEWEAGWNDTNNKKDREDHVFRTGF